jgi:phosphatidate phosphatase APP1
MAIVAVLATALLSSAIVQNAWAAPALKVKVTEKLDPITRGDIQTLTVKVTDASNKPVKDAVVSGVILYAGGKTAKTFSGKTNAKGEFVHAWKIDSNSIPGLFGVDVKVTKSSFDAGHASTIFTVKPKK